jgi:hypothetical protein
VAFAAGTNALEDVLMQGMTALNMNEYLHSRDELPTKPSIILEDTDDMSNYEPRPSFENHASARDMMAHLHGMTPVPRRNQRPPRLSMQSVGSVSTTGTACKYNAASPFPQAPMSSIGQNSTVKCGANDFVGT